MNGFVEDLENIVAELYEVQNKIDSGIVGKAAGGADGGGNGGGIAPPSDIAKQLHDLEAHLNTSIITEKSVRKAQDKYLAEEVDKVNKQMIAVADKLKIYVDDEGDVVDKKRSKNDAEILKQKFDIESIYEVTA